MAGTIESSTIPRDASQSQAAPPAYPAVNSTEEISQHTGSIGDSGLTKRPRDARLIHMILANMGVNAYQERVPVQLLDFCYRYTSSTLQDALHLTSDFGQNVTGSGRISNTNADLNNITLQALRLSIAARTQYQFSPSLSKDSLVELASEKNRVALPTLGRDWGLRLPPERYCLTGVGFGLKDEFDSEGEEEDYKMEDVADATVNDTTGTQDGGSGDEKMEDVLGNAGDRSA
ncbi:MAG: Transcription initiation factor TFIID subunit 9 [Stictis urceolatum]|nr:Transcription initiation factor TFIID subunit 9 [Stictis urceolata]